MIDLISKNMLQSSGEHGPVILMYHSILPQKFNTSNWPWAISYDMFCQHLELLKNSGWKTIRIKDLGKTEGYQRKSVVITFDDGYKNNYKAFEALLDYGMTASWFIVTNDIGRFSSWSEQGFSKQEMLSQQDLLEFFKHGIEVGSHTCSHRHLPQLDKVDLIAELHDSKAKLEDICGAEVESFSYPYGEYNTQCVNTVNDMGYKYACTTSSGWALAGSDFLTMKRITVYANDSLSSFARKLAFATNDVGPMALARYYGKRAIQRFLD